VPWAFPADRRAASVIIHAMPTLQSQERRVPQATAPPASRSASEHDELKCPCPTQTVAGQSWALPEESGRVTLPDASGPLPSGNRDFTVCGSCDSARFPVQDVGRAGCPAWRASPRQR
jgi:hypothetical protein